MAFPYRVDLCNFLQLFWAYRAKPVKTYLITSGTIFGIIALMHLLRGFAEWRLLETDPWSFLAMAALGVLAAALAVWAWCLLRLHRRA